MAKRGRKKDPFEEISWAPPKKYYKEKPETAIKAFARLKRDRVLAGYSELYKIVYDSNPTPVDMKKIHKIADQLGF